MNNISLLPTEEGFFGEFGGQILPDGLKEEFSKITETFLKLKDDADFNKELNDLLKYYTGRPSPIYFAKNLSKKIREQKFI